jgi:isoleucyl-tRNA synthetase
MSTTMDVRFMESTWWVFSQLYKKGVVYQGYRVMPFSTALQTPLSNEEVRAPLVSISIFSSDVVAGSTGRLYAFFDSHGLLRGNVQNYKDVNDPSVVVTFPLLEDPNTCLLAWTTTP